MVQCPAVRRWGSSSQLINLSRARFWLRSQGSFISAHWNWMSNCIYYGDNIALVVLANSATVGLTRCNSQSVIETCCRLLLWKLGKSGEVDRLTCNLQEHAQQTNSVYFSSTTALEVWLLRVRLASLTLLAWPWCGLGQPSEFCRPGTDLTAQQTGHVSRY